ncbi:MAG: lysophospholipase L1-like esterase [Glaciecola sp.]|jgi:lysophospholipase L1-like esterase
MQHFLRTIALAICLGLLGNLSQASAASPQQIGSIGSAGNKQKSGPWKRAIRTKVMCIGDSNTHGVQGYTSYRYPLWFKLARLGSLVEFVGTRFTVEAENGTTVPDLNLFNRYYTYFDRDHQGYSGFRTDQVLPLLPQAIATESPDVCLILLGTNDIGQRGSVGVTDALSNLKLTVDAVRSQAPATLFFIASIPPIGPGTWYANNAGYVDTFNSQLASQVPNWSLPNSQAQFVDVHGALNLATDMLPDGVHPNQMGQQKVAQVFYNALIPAISGGFLPAPQSSVAVQTPSFEALGLADGLTSTLPLPDWTYPNMPHILPFVMNPDEQTYSGAFGSGVPNGADGDEVLSLENTGGEPSLGWVYQTMPTTMATGKTYNLTMAVGNRAPTNTRGTTGFGGYEIQILVGNTTVASSANQVTPMPGTFETAQLNFLSNNVSPSLVGSAITLRMRMTWSTANTATDFDKVELTKN